MKTKCLFLSLPFFLFTLAMSGAEKTVTLKGLITVANVKSAVLEVAGPTRPGPEEFLLSEGQQLNGIEMAKIDAEKGAVSVTVDGEQRSLLLEPGSDAASVNKSGNSSAPSIRLNSITLQMAVVLYADNKDRTVLQHPQLGLKKFSLVANPTSKAEAAAAFEKMFEEQQVAVIPDGAHFVMIVPSSLTNAVAPRAEGIAKTGELIPTLSINFWQTPIPMVESTYADYQKKKIVNPNGPWSNAMITFRQTCPLSKPEILYAFETLFAWNGIRLVPEGNDLKVEQIR